MRRLRDHGHKLDILDACLRPVDLVAAKLKFEIEIADKVFENEWDTARMLGYGAREASESSLAAFNDLFQIAGAPDKTAVYLCARSVSSGVRALNKEK